MRRYEELHATESNTRHLDAHRTVNYLSLAYMILNLMIVLTTILPKDGNESVYYAGICIMGLGLVSGELSTRRKADCGLERMICCLVVYSLFCVFLCFYGPKMIRVVVIIIEIIVIIGSYTVFRILEKKPEKRKKRKIELTYNEQIKNQERALVAFLALVYTIINSSISLTLHSELCNGLGLLSAIACILTIGAAPFIMKEMKKKVFKCEEAIICFSVFLIITIICAFVWTNNTIRIIILCCEGVVFIGAFLSLRLLRNSITS